MGQTSGDVPGRKAQTIQDLVESLRFATEQAPADSLPPGVGGIYAYLLAIAEALQAEQEARGGLETRVRDWGDKVNAGLDTAIRIATEANYVAKQARTHAESAERTATDARYTAEDADRRARDAISKAESAEREAQQARGTR